MFLEGSHPGRKNNNLDRMVQNMENFATPEYAKITAATCQHPAFPALNMLDGCETNLSVEVSRLFGQLQVYFPKNSCWYLLILVCRPSTRRLTFLRSSFHPAKVSDTLIKVAGLKIYSSINGEMQLLAEEGRKLWLARYLILPRSEANNSRGGRY
jgi:hypothetical protein